MKKSIFPKTIGLVLTFFFLGFGINNDKEINITNKIDDAPECSFSIIVIPDTQQYFGNRTKLEPESNKELTNPVFKSQIDWILKNKKSQNIVFVSHVGDIVDINNEDQWSLARKYMSRLFDQIPFAISIGNHDMTAEGNSSLFQKYFPVCEFENFYWYGGFFNGHINKKISSQNANSYQLYSAGGVNFIHLHIECNAPDDVLDWANQILDSHKDRFAIISTHMFLGPINKPLTPEEYFKNPKGIMQWSKIHGITGNSPQQMWDKCFSKHKNLNLIFCGDQSRSNSIHKQLEGINGNVVHALLSDYMLTPGPLRIYRFDVEHNELDVITYDVINHRIINKTSTIPKKSDHNFTIKINLSIYKNLN